MSMRKPVKSNQKTVYAWSRLAITLACDTADGLLILNSGTKFKQNLVWW